jgi:hypothetical protein
MFLVMVSLSVSVSSLCGQDTEEAAPIPGNNRGLEGVLSGMTGLGFEL